MLLGPCITSILATMATLFMPHWTSTGGADDRYRLLSYGQVALSTWLFSASSTLDALCVLYHEKQRSPPLFPTPICLFTWIDPRHLCFWPSHLSPSRPRYYPLTTDLECEYILTLRSLLLLPKGAPPEALFIGRISCHHFSQGHPEKDIVQSPFQFKHTKSSHAQTKLRVFPLLSAGHRESFIVTEVS